uniref:hypothetical protein n=1 Tax=unclassified Erwinia TaxID=2622719 RepID=UPI00403FB10D
MTLSRLAGNHDAAGSGHVVPAIKTHSLRQRQQNNLRPGCRKHPAGLRGTVRGRAAANAPQLILAVPQQQRAIMLIGFPRSLNKKCWIWRALSFNRCSCCQLCQPLKAPSVSILAIIITIKSSVKVNPRILFMAAILLPEEMTSSEGSAEREAFSSTIQLLR